MLEIDPQPNKRLHAGAQTYAINRHRIRRAQPAFHPDAEQLVLDMKEGLMGIMRVADSGQHKNVRVFILTRAHFHTGQREKSIHNQVATVINREDNAHNQE
ncbi:hypothetical protein Q8W30_17410 [Neptunomonas phycophila]|uniref:Uncharacterized protein n=1 Tax=Neptunomonas phycophila TaxID=1572645 RepID=A0ABT9EZ66_9GAMM|nr:hypothetical protein [Neptunomonas phycophila]MDP2524345.1 hypothetical protein [Neptunomonas phycophila]